ncbi:MAG: tetratricopeptide repeat protein [Elusimicrobiota bacterium]
MQRTKFGLILTAVLTAAVLCLVQAGAQPGTIKDAMDLAGAGKYDEAAEGLNRLISQKPEAENLEARLSLGLVYYKMKRYDNALEEFGKSISISPDNPMAYYFMGMIYEQKAVGSANGTTRALKQKALDAWQKYLDSSAKPANSSLSAYKHAGISKKGCVKRAKKHIKVLKGELVK